MRHQSTSGGRSPLRGKGMSCLEVRMKKTMARAAVLLAGLAVLGLSTRLPAQATKEGQPEIRFFVLDKNGSPIDVKGWTGAIEVKPENGTAKTYKLEPFTPAWKSKADSEKNPEERYSNN